MRNARELVSDCGDSAPAGAVPNASPRPAPLRAVSDLEGEHAGPVGSQTPEARPARSSLPKRFDGARRVLVDERGAVTAEYAIVIMAAVAFAGVLVAIIRSEQIRKMLVDLVENALGTGG